MSDESLWNVQYYQRVSQLNPIAYWMLNERQGTIAWDQVTLHGAAAVRHGTHVGVALFQPGIGDGQISPLYDGAASYTNIYSASFAGVFDGDEGSAIVWIRVSGAGVWTDNTMRFFLSLRADANNRVMLYKNVDNTIIWARVAGGVTLSNWLGVTPLDWFSMGITWSRAVDEVRCYYNGVQTGATLNGLLAFAGPLAATRTVIGATSTVPASVWDGYLAHGVVLDRPLTATQMAPLYVIE